MYNWKGLWEMYTHGSMQRGTLIFVFNHFFWVVELYPCLVTTYCILQFFQFSFWVLFPYHNTVATEWLAGSIVYNLIALLLEKDKKHGKKLFFFHQIYFQNWSNDGLMISNMLRNKAWNILLDAWGALSEFKLYPSGSI